MAQSSKSGFIPSIGEILERCLVGGDTSGFGSLKDISSIRRKLDNLDEDDFYPVERIDEKAEDLEEQLKRAQVRPMMAKAGYRELDPIFLSWCLPKSKLPAFMIFSVHETGFSIRVAESVRDVTEMDDTNYEISPDLPEELEGYFEETVLHLADLSCSKHHGDELSIEAEFEGVIPRDTKAKIEKALRGDLIDQVFIICEASKWDLEVVNTSSLGDPLAVGWNEDTETLYLIDIFEAVPLKEYLTPKKALK